MSIKELSEKRAENFKNLNSLNVNDKVEKKGNLTYLSWSDAWSEFKKVCPDATYRVIQNPLNNLPYFEDQNMGIMVFTEVTCDELSYSMWLPVMDNQNRAMKSVPYSYTVFNKYKNQEETKVVEAATMFDINKTIMRCLVKNLAMFGLGLYIYSGEDLPEDNNGGKESNEPTPKPKRSMVKMATVSDKYGELKRSLEETNDLGRLLSLFYQNQEAVNSDQNLKNLFTTRKQQILTQQAV